MSDDILAKRVCIARVHLKTSTRVVETKGYAPNERAWAIGQNVPMRMGAAAGFISAESFGVDCWRARRSAKAK